MAEHKRAAAQASTLADIDKWISLVEDLLKDRKVKKSKDERIVAFRDQLMVLRGSLENFKTRIGEGASEDQRVAAVFGVEPAGEADGLLLEARRVKGWVQDHAEPPVFVSWYRLRSMATDTPTNSINIMNVPGFQGTKRGRKVHAIANYPSALTRYKGSELTAVRSLAKKLDGAEQIVEALDFLEMLDFVDAYATFDELFEVVSVAVFDLIVAHDLVNNCIDEICRRYEGIIVEPYVWGRSHYSRRKYSIERAIFKLSERQLEVLLQRFNRLTNIDSTTPPSEIDSLCYGSLPNVSKHKTSDRPKIPNYEADRLPDVHAHLANHIQRLSRP